MKRILVPVDFSDTSAAAVRFGTYLAETMKLDLTLLHVFDPLLSTSQTISTRARENERQRLEVQLTALAHQHVEPVLAAFRGRAEGIPAVTTAALEGTAAQTILWQSTEDDVALIVLGGVGAGAGSHAPGLFGGVARTLALQGACPVILIPKDYGSPEVERLALAFDGVDDIRQMSAFARRIIVALRPEVHYVHVCEQGAAEEARRKEEFMELASGPAFPSYTYQFDTIPAGKVTEQLLHYTKQHSIDLLVLGGQRRGFFERLFEADHLGPLVNHCEVPLLIIPFGQITD